MARPEFTALIETYNHERFIEETIVSVLEQDFASSDIEIPRWTTVPRIARPRSYRNSHRRFGNCVRTTHGRHPHSISRFQRHDDK